MNTVKSMTRNTHSLTIAVSTVIIRGYNRSLQVPLSSGSWCIGIAAFSVVATARLQEAGVHAPRFDG